MCVAVLVECGVCGVTGESSGGWEEEEEAACGAEGGGARWVTQVAVLIRTGRERLEESGAVRGRSSFRSRSLALRSPAVPVGPVGPTTGKSWLIFRK